MRICLTGATGYIGGELARALLARRFELRCVVRDPARARDLERSGAVCLEGDVTDRYSLREAMSGCDWAVHAAAVVGQHRPPEEMERVNVEGSDNVASLAYKLGVGRFLSVSSMAFFGGSGRDGSPADEESPVLAPLPTPYADTKHRGERAIRAWEEKGLPLNTVFPSLVYGPPAKPDGANAFLARLARAGYPVLVAGDRITSWVHVEDVVDGILRVIDRAPPGRGYLLAGEAIRIDDLARKVAAVAGVRPPRVRVPLAVARLGLGIASPLLAALGRPSRVSSEQLRTLERHWNFDDSRAREELGWRARGLDEGLPSALAHRRREAGDGATADGGGARGR